MPVPSTTYSETPIEPATSFQHPLEGVGENVLGQRPVAAAVDQEGKQPLCVVGVELLELVVAHRPVRNPRRDSYQAVMHLSLIHI